MVSNGDAPYLKYHRHSTASNHPTSEVAEAWARRFESVDRLEVTPIESVSDYQQLLLSKNAVP